MLTTIDTLPNAPGRVAEPDNKLPPVSAGWRLEDIAFDAIDPSITPADEPLLLMLVASSFIESGTHLYASNLIAHFDGHAEIAHWLKTTWEPEELQHGRALRTYVAHVWPDFDWEQAYAAFIHVYQPLCNMGKLEHRRGLEMAARCVVETATTSLYRAIHACVREPVLRSLVRHISEDEIGHYKQFFRHFRNYQQHEPSSRRAVLGALLRRSLEIRREDSDCGLRHAHAERYRGRTGAATLDQTRHAIHALLRKNVPYELAGAMWLRPLHLDARFERQIRRMFPLIANALVVR